VLSFLSGLPSLPRGSSVQESRVVLQCLWTTFSRALSLNDSSMKQRSGEVRTVWYCQRHFRIDGRAYSRNGGHSDRITSLQNKWGSPGRSLRDQEISDLFPRIICSGIADRTDFRWLFTCTAYSFSSLRKVTVLKIKNRTCGSCESFGNWHIFRLKILQKEHYEWLKIFF